MVFRVVFFNPSTDDPIFCSKTVDSSNNVITKMRSDRWVKHKNEQKVASGRLGICHISVALFFLLQYTWKLSVCLFLMKT